MLHLNEKLIAALQHARGEVVAQQSARCEPQGIGEYLEVDENC